MLTAILGVVGTFITQLIKKVSGTNSNMAVILTVVISIVLGALVAFFNGTFQGGDLMTNLATASSIIFAVATIAYKTLLADQGVLPIAANFKG